MAGKKKGNKEAVEEIEKEVQEAQAEEKEPEKHNEEAKKPKKRTSVTFEGSFDFEVPSSISDDQKTSWAWAKAQDLIASMNERMTKTKVTIKVPPQYLKKQ